MLQAALHFWEPRHRCFDFNGIDLVPTVEEYRRLLDILEDHRRKVYLPNPRRAGRRAFTDMMEILIWNAPFLVNREGGE